MSGTEEPGPLLVMWDCESYDTSSRGHLVDDGWLDQLTVVNDRVPVKHRLRLMHLE
jgi:hypothetical protein